MTIKVKIFLISAFILLGFTAQCQFTKQTYRLVEKQQKKVIKNSTQFANNWIRWKSDSLHLPENIKLSRMNFSPYEEPTWELIDSMLTVQQNKSNRQKAKEILIADRVRVYSISGHFYYKNSSTESSICFNFDWNGNIISAEVREDSNNPYTTKYFKY